MILTYRSKLLGFMVHSYVLDCAPAMQVLSVHADTRVPADAGRWVDNHFAGHAVIYAEVCVEHREAQIDVGQMGVSGFTDYWFSLETPEQVSRGTGAAPGVASPPMLQEPPAPLPPSLRANFAHGCPCAALAPPAFQIPPTVMEVDELPPLPPPMPQNLAPGVGVAPPPPPRPEHFEPGSRCAAVGQAVVVIENMPAGEEAPPPQPPRVDVLAAIDVDQIRAPAVVLTGLSTQYSTVPEARRQQVKTPAVKLVFFNAPLLGIAEDAVMAYNHLGQMRSSHWCASSDDVQIDFYFGTVDMQPSNPTCSRRLTLCLLRRKRQFGE